MTPTHSAVVMTTPLRAELGDVAMVQGRLARVISINEGNRAIGFEFVGSEPCPTCGKPDRVTINEGCPNWNSDVRPVQTCGPDILASTSNQAGRPEGEDA